MSTGDGQQDAGAPGDGAGVLTVRVTTQTAPESSAAAAHSAGTVRHEHELYGGSRGTVHGRTQGNVAGDTGFLPGIVKVVDFTRSQRSLVF